MHYEIHMARGEVTHVDLVGLGDAGFDACLVDAAYKMTPPLPDFSLNSDDQTVARYPLTFNLRDEHPIVVPGDADSDSPLDIDAIEGGVPGPIHVDATTPLGGLKKQHQGAQIVGGQPRGCCPREGHGPIVWPSGQQRPARLLGRASGCCG